MHCVSPVSKLAKFDFQIALGPVVAWWKRICLALFLACIHIIPSQKTELNEHADFNRIPIGSLKIRKPNAMHLGKKFLDAIFSVTARVKIRSIFFYQMYGVASILDSQFYDAKCLTITNLKGETPMTLSCPRFHQYRSQAPDEIFSLEFRNCYDHLSTSIPFQTTFWYNTYCMVMKNFLMT